MCRVRLPRAVEAREGGCGRSCMTALSSVSIISLLVPVSEERSKCLGENEGQDDKDDNGAQELKL